MKPLKGFVYSIKMMFSSRPVSGYHQQRKKGAGERRRRLRKLQRKARKAQRR